ncbi:hypothetical protein C8R44DRAFT_75949 [Mycena epipterygia]|nr:hypothetical protein C8R44DRAFT_75949 [Mycena epipterygia]
MPCACRVTDPTPRRRTLHVQFLCDSAFIPQPLDRQRVLVSILVKAFRCAELTTRTR